MSQERELKFRLDPALHDAVRAHPILLTLAPAPQQQTLQSWYFDTPTHTLRQAGMALRVRHTADGRRILTLKSSPAQGLQFSRGEWEFDIDTDAPDAAALQRLRDTPLDALIDAGALAPGLRAVLGTQMQRTVWHVDWQGTRLEVCLDAGLALGGPEPDAPSLPISELEIELIDGHWPHAFDLAWALAQDLPLLLSPVNKMQLAAQAAELSTLQLPPLARELAPLDSGGQAVAAALQQSAALMAVGAQLLQTDPQSDTVHQMRVQLRRLRVLLQLLQTTGPASQRSACRWLRGEWRWAGQLLGMVRDVDVCLEHAKVLRPDPAACAPISRDLQHKRDAHLDALLGYLRSARFGRVLLAQARWAQCWSSGQVIAPDLSTERLAARLLRFERRDSQLQPRRWAELLAIWDGQSAAPLDAPWDALHTLRLRAKRLRYTLEWLAPWADQVLGKQGRAWLRLATGLQNDLGNALDTLRLARWMGETAAATDLDAATQSAAGVQQAFDQVRSSLQHALQTARHGR
ncbi:MAG: CHAD domain-containing protein [Thiomonas sp.]